MQLKLSLLQIATMAAYFAVSGCVFFPKSELNECPSVAQKFFLDNTGSRIERYKNYSTFDKYQIYICGAQHVEPPALELAPIFAKGGKPVLTIIKRELYYAKDDETIRDIVRILNYMKQENTFSPSNDPELVTLAKNKVNGMKDGTWKEIATNNLHELLVKNN